MFDMFTILTNYVLTTAKPGLYLGVAVAGKSKNLTFICVNIRIRGKNHRKKSTSYLPDL